MNKNKQHTTTRTAQTAQAATTDQDSTAATFAALLRAYEQAHTDGTDSTAALLALATACAHSVLKKCTDPQRKTAPDRETVSNNGISPALVAVKRGIVHDLALLDNLTAAHNAAYAFRFNDAGDMVQEVADKGAEKAATAMQSETLSDGLDIVNAAAVAILEQTAEHATAAPGWMEAPYTMRRLSAHVLIRADDAAKWEEVQTSPIREVYRAIRREVQNSRAMQTDPRNGYLYIEDTAADPDSDQTETTYRRLQKWADLGGYTTSGHYQPGKPESKYSGAYTADAQTAADYETIMQALNLTARQAQIVALRMRGYGYTAIASYLGVTPRCIEITVARLRTKCEKIGFTPSMWAEMTAEK